MDEYTDKPGSEQGFWNRLDETANPPATNDSSPKNGDWDWMNEGWSYL